MGGRPEARRACREVVVDFAHHGDQGPSLTHIGFWVTAGCLWAQSSVGGWQLFRPSVRRRCHYCGRWVPRWAPENYQALSQSLFSLIINQ